MAIDYPEHLRVERASGGQKVRVRRPRLSCEGCNRIKMLRIEDGKPEGKLELYFLQW